MADRGLVSVFRRRGAKKIPAAYGQVEATGMGMLYRCQFDDLQEMARYLVSLGLPFVVRRPDALCEVLQQLATSIMQMTIFAASSTSRE